VQTNVCTHPHPPVQTLFGNKKEKGLFLSLAEAMSCPNSTRLSRQETMLFAGNTRKPSGAVSSVSSSSLTLAQKATTHLGHTASLDIDDSKYSNERIRKTSIICTIGPKTNSVEMLSKLRSAGMNIVRLNFSHGSYEFHQSIIDNTRKTFEVLPGRPVAIALDTKGPEIRTGLNEDDAEINLESGDLVTLTMDDKYKVKSTKELIYIDYKNLPKVVKPGKLVFIDDGLISMEVTETGEDFVKAKILNSGVLGSRKGVNLPETNVDLPALSEYDVEALKFGVQNGIDMVFASFIRKADDVIQIRRVLGEEGRHIQIISKIENHEGVRNFQSILEVTDGIMVARGDLGIEIPAEKVFLAQKMMISRCNIAGKPVICATQMLESMTTNPRPTRAEVSDVANAVLDGADCVMLSGETAKGKYPLNAVEMMARICLNAEAAMFYGSFFNEIRQVTIPENVGESLASAAVNATLGSDIGAIFVLTTTGSTARLVSKYRPQCPIVTVTRSEQTARICHLYRGCYPLYCETPKPADAHDSNIWQDDVDGRILWAMDQARSMGLVKPGMTVIAIQGWKQGVGYTNTMRILTVPE